jgi:hypothetical protein
MVRSTKLFIYMTTELNDVVRVLCCLKDTWPLVIRRMDTNPLADLEEARPFLHSGRMRR